MPSSLARMRLLSSALSVSLSVTLSAWTDVGDDLADLTEVHCTRLDCMPEALELDTVACTRCAAVARPQGFLVETTTSTNGAFLPLIGRKPSRQF